MDHLNRIVRGSKTPALMPRVSGPMLSGPRPSAAGSKDSSSGRVGAASNRNSGGRGSGSGGRGGRGGGGRGGSGDDDMLSMMYDPLTGEPLEPEAKDGKASAAAATAMVSPKCEDKVDYDVMVDLVDHIMTTEEREAAKKETAAAAMGTGGGGRGGGRGSGGGYNNRRGQHDGSWRGASNGSRGNVGDSAGRGRGLAGGEPLGAILIFLPGFAEIDQLVRALERHPRIGRGAAKIFPLHSSLPSHQQKSIFQRMPPGVRKIVVSTNIAETSVS